MVLTTSVIHAVKMFCFCLSRTLAQLSYPYVQLFLLNIPSLMRIDFIAAAFVGIEAIATSLRPTQLCSQVHKKYLLDWLEGLVVTSWGWSSVHPRSNFSEN
ncbi:hypothetical protein EV424DRAFT_479983 [Suillus variegatus]|nr:hypothetical protein EV424DRAFT_479983 [Suillus variegatus]